MRIISLQVNLFSNFIMLCIKSKEDDDAIIDIDTININITFRRERVNGGCHESDFQNDISLGKNSRYREKIDKRNFEGYNYHCCPEVMAMKWSMTQLQKIKSQGLTIDETINLDSLKERDPEIRYVSPIRVRGKAEIHAREVIFDLHITGELVLPSSRTLADVTLPIDIRTKETFLYEDEETDDEVNLIEGETIDLIPVVEDLILLEIPLQVIGEDDEMPGSQKSGQGWTYYSSESELKKDTIDPRLAKLKQLLEDQDESR